MANNNIAQTFDSVKAFSEKEPRKRTQYLEGFSKEDYDQTCYAMSGQLRSKLESTILAGTNAQAFSILSAVEVIDHIPAAGENFVPLNGFASFYGVAEEYLKGVLTRHGFIKKNYPDDIVRVSAEDISGRPDIPLVKDNFWKVPGRDDLVRYRLSDAYGPPCVSLPRRYTFLIYSPRIVLAAALALLYTDKSGENNTAKRVALAIKRSNYRVIVADEQKNSSGNTIIPSGAIPVGKNGEINLDIELLNHIIRTTTKAILEYQATAAKKRRKKPDGWDDIQAKWKHGKLTTHKAAKAAGMTVAEFCDYINGKKTFD